MDYEVFEKGVLGATKAMYPDYDVQIGRVDKVSGSYTGLIINSADSVGTCFNLREIYDSAGGDITDEVLAKLYASICDGVSRGAEMVKAYTITDYDKVKERLFLSAEPLDYDALDGYPYKDVGLNVVAVVRMTCADDDGTTSAAVPENLLELWGVTFDELYADAMKSGMKLMPPEVLPLSHFAGLADGDSRIAYITNARGIYGASSIFYPGVLDRITRDFVDDLYILPISKDGVIAVPCKEYRWFDLMKLVNLINGAWVSKEDFLSSAVFRYDAAAKTLKEVE